MARRVTPIFLVLLLASTALHLLVSATPRRLIRSTPAGVSGTDAMGLIARVSQAEKECDAGSGSTAANDLLICFLGFNGTSDFDDENFVSGATEAQQFLGCFDPYKRLLEGCSTFPGRDNDLAMLDAVQVALANDGEIIKAIQTHRFGGGCRDREADERITKLMLKCFQDGGIIQFMSSESSRSITGVVGNFCSGLSAIKTCVNRGRISDPCPEAIRDLDFILTVFDRVESNAEHKDVMDRCLNGDD